LHSLPLSAYLNQLSADGMKNVLPGIQLR
jgi:hypothetical protein